jgi:hypothetical protein
MCQHLISVERCQQQQQQQRNEELVPISGSPQCRSAPVELNQNGI